jgi:hypothetical protein
MKKFIQKFLGLGRYRPPPEVEWLAVTIKLKHGEFGSETERAEVRSVGHRLEEVARRVEGSALDGDEYGNHYGTLYFTGRDADELYEAIEPLLRHWPMLEGGYVIKRYGHPTRSERVNF